MPNISVVAANVNGVSAGAELPDSDKKELEELWAYFVANPGYWGHAVFGSATEMAAYKASANAYLRTRKEGALKLRQIRRQKLPENEMKFIIEPYTSTAE
jgi:hypothetical protein